jgi:hypothetical protein
LYTCGHSHGVPRRARRVSIRLCSNLRLLPHPSSYKLSTWGPLDLQAKANVRMEWCTALVTEISNSIRVKRSSILTTATRKTSLTSHGTLVHMPMPLLVSSRDLFPSRAQRSRKRHATEANSLPSMLSSMTTSAAPAIVSFASYSSFTSTSMRARDRCGDRSCTAIVQSDHGINGGESKILSTD